jgi:hypothetical protein
LLEKRTRQKRDGLVGNGIRIADRNITAFLCRDSTVHGGFGKPGTEIEQHGFARRAAHRNAAIDRRAGRVVVEWCGQVEAIPTLFFAAVIQPM